MAKRITLIVLLAPLLAIQLSAQTSQLTEFLKTFQTYQENNPVEKVFLHLDKTEYAQAETIWIKSYLVAGPGHLPSPLSKNVYVELLTEAGELVKQLTLRSENGFSKASLVIPRDQPQGHYYLRAYTNWMRNQDQSFFFNKKIKVHSVKASEEIVAEQRAETPELNFYPEGGHLVRGLPVRLAFEVTGIDLTESAINGKIYSASGEVAKRFSTQHEGRGMIPFVPTENGYYALLEGFDQRFELPAIQASGQVMSVNNQREDAITVSIKSSATTTDPFHVVAHTRGFIVFAAETKLVGTRGFVKINKATLPEGITHITLLDHQMEPVAERLTFIEGNPDLNIKLSTNKNSYDKRELATIGIKVTDAEGAPVQGSFSLSAYNSNLVQNDQSDYNIKNHLLLGSDLKGHISNPSQYFEDTDEAGRNMDLLMMVNGWRRFKWEEVSTETTHTHVVERNLRVDGQILKNSGGIVKNGKVLLINGQKGASERFALTDDKGRFTFTDLSYSDTTFLQFQGFHRGGMKNVQFKMDPAGGNLLPLQNRYNQYSAFENPLRIDAYKKYAKTAIYIDSTYRRVNGVTYLGEVTVVADKREEKYRVLQSQYGKGESFVNFDEIEFKHKSGRDPFTMMMGRVPGFSLRAAAGPSEGGDTNVSATVGGDARFRAPVLRQGAFIGTPLVFLDNQEVPWDVIYEIPAEQIDYVEVYKSGSANMFGTRGFSGAIAFYTLKGKKYFEQVPKAGRLYTQLGGYHTPREFYSPRYDKSNKQQYIPDQRATIFWAPMITTNADGEASVSFYTPDDNSYVIIDVQGLSFKGKAGVGNAGFDIRSGL